MHLNDAEQNRWLEILKDKTPWCPDRTLLPISVGEQGHLVVDAPVHRALYLVVDADDEVVYVGKVDRAEGTVTDRFRYHHAYDEDWDRVWVIGLSSTVGPNEVLGWESTLIGHFDPVGNKTGRYRGHRW
jgi:hypothetical protein